MHGCIAEACSSPSCNPVPCRCLKAVVQALLQEPNMHSTLPCLALLNHAPIHEGKGVAASQA